ncbi:MAG TPA: hypothetical protein VEF53_16330 [Patescibacteria group bacterium]|jgi:hypothetical protein|nr:hypothetical protein [Patescibacteria group bacterium]
MILTRIICIIMIIIGLFISIKPLKIMNAVRTMLILNELEADDFRVFAYRASGITVIIINILLLMRTFAI